VDDSAESGLALHNGVWDTHLLAESWQEDDELDWVDIVWNEDERGLLVLNQGNDVVETVLDGVWLLADVLLLLAVLDSGGLLEETLLLLGLGLWAVLVEELEGLGGAVAVEDVVELSDGWWDLEAHVQDLALALETNILGPLYGAGEVASWLDVLTNTKVAWAPLNERVLFACKYLSRDLEEDINVPWPASWRHRPWWQGTGPEPPSFRTLEAIIEKRNQHKFVMHDRLVSKG